MKSKYSFMALKEIKALLPAMQMYGVSKVARSPGQFLDMYTQYGKRLPMYWMKRRENFIARHYEQWKTNPTLRRTLALNAWAFDPPQIIS